MRALAQGLPSAARSPSRPQSSGFPLVAHARDSRPALLPLGSRRALSDPVNRAAQRPAVRPASAFPTATRPTKSLRPPQAPQSRPHKSATACSTFPRPTPAQSLQSRRSCSTRRSKNGAHRPRGLRSNSVVLRAAASARASRQSIAPRTRSKSRSSSAECARFEKTAVRTLDKLHTAPSAAATPSPQTPKNSQIFRAHKDAAHPPAGPKRARKET